MKLHPPSLSIAVPSFLAIAAGTSSAQAGPWLEQSVAASGGYNVISPADVDGDGDEDFVSGCCWFRNKVACASPPS